MPTDPQIIQVPVDGTSTPVEEKEMAEVNDLSPNVANQMLTQLMQSGTIAQNNFITVQKAQDYDFQVQKNTVNLANAVGIREVASRESMQGKPSGTT